jgi:hypothetical protein
MVAIYSDDDVQPHTPSDAHLWNESMYLVWYDDVAGAGGFHRFGYQPNRGTVNYQLGISTRSGCRYRRTRPLTPGNGRERVDGGFAIDDFLTVLHRPNGVRWQTQDEHLQFDIVFEDFMPRYKAPELWGFRSSKESVLDANISDHYQLSGRVTGTCRLDDELIDISCLGYRDHSWGVRDWSVLAPFRCFTAQFGPDLAVSYNTMIGGDDRRLTIGHVYRSGTVTRITRGDLVVLQEFDGITSRGSHAVVETADGMRLTIELEALDNVALEADEFRSLFAVGSARMGSRTGIGSCEVFNGVAAMPTPAYVEGAALVDGVSRYQPFGTLR